MIITRYGKTKIIAKTGKDVVRIVKGLMEENHERRNNDNGKVGTRTSR